MATADHHHKAHTGNLGGTHVKQYDNLKTLLKNAKSTTGQDLYAHLQAVFKELIMHYPEQALDKLEEVSYLLKKESENGAAVLLKQFLVTEEKKEYTDLALSQQQYIDKLLTFFKKPPVEGDEEEGAAASEEPPAATGYVSDLTNDQKIFEWAGIGFGEVEAYRIMKSLKVKYEFEINVFQKLAIDSGAGNVRFFGKITGTEADYYIAEGSLDAGDEEGGDEKPADFEPRGTGVNKFVYWVTNNVLSDWTKLPDLQTKDIIAARQIKVLFTGKLDRPIYTNPYFFGQERHYLRAQIARIIHSTTIVPAGLYKVTEDNDKEIEEFVPEGDAPFKPASTHDMAKAQNWVHYTQSILNVGRTTHIQPEVPEGAPENVTEETLMKELEDRDPYEKRLKPITQDSHVAVAEHAKQMAWVVKHCGDKNIYQHPVDPTTQVNYGVVVVRSLQWPGSYTFYTQGRYLSVYIGNGHKYETQSYYPVHPPKIMDDPAEEWFQQPEPTPLYEDPVPVEQEEGDLDGQQQDDVEEE